MKKWMRYIVLTMLFVLFSPAAFAAAQNNKAVLTAGNDSVSVGLNLPEGKLETITSLRLKLCVTVESGSIKEPSFQFESTLKSAVKDAEIIQETDGSYLVDIILSGKADQDIFENSEYAKLGTLSLNPAGSGYQVKVEAAEFEEDAGAAVKYMDGSGVSEITVPLADAATVTLKDKPAVLQSDFNKKIGLRIQSKKGSRSVNFEWDKIESADGYVLYEYGSKTNGYRAIKTITGSAVTAYSKKFKYASQHTFSIRAFQRAEYGSQKFGEYSEMVKVTLSPDKVKGVKVKKRTKTQISWKKVSGAKGYQIYASKKKNGRYTLLKTIKKARTTKFTVKKPKASKTYYKIRAYVNGDNGKKKYGEFSAIKS